MSKAAAPWIILTADKPGLDAESRGAINEWCGVIGRQAKYRRPKNSNTPFSSLAVNWKTQKQPDSDRLEAVKLLTELEGRSLHGGRSFLDRRSKSGDDVDPEATALEAPWNN